MSRGKYKPPRKNLGDTGHVVAKAVISAIPVLGGPASELFQALAVPPLEKRRQAWMEEAQMGCASWKRIADCALTS